MTQTENYQTALLQTQREALIKCQQELNEARSQRDALADEVIAKHEKYIPTQEETSAMQSQMCRPHIERWNKAEQERDEAHTVIRDLLGAIAPYQAHTTQYAPHLLDLNLTGAIHQATHLLAPYITENG